MKNRIPIIPQLILENRRNHDEKPGSHLEYPIIHRKPRRSPEARESKGIPVNTGNKKNERINHRNSKKIVHVFMLARGKSTLTHILLFAWPIFGNEVHYTIVRNRTCFLRLIIEINVQMWHTSNSQLNVFFRLKQLMRCTLSETHMHIWYSYWQ